VTDPIRGRAASFLMLLIAATAMTGCGVFRKGQVEEFPAPPESTAEVVETEPPVEETDSEPAVDQPAPAVEPPVEEEPPVEGAAEVVEAEPTETDVTPPDVVTKPAAENPPPPAKPPDEPKTDSIPAIDQVSLVDAEQPEPRLLQDEEEKLTPESLRDDFREAQKLSAELTQRKLTAEQRAQVESGRGFLDDARKAVRLQDLERAGVLLEKCLVLLRDAKANSGT